MGRYSARTVRRVTTASSLGAEMACDDCCDLMLQADRDQRAKEEKIRIAIQKIKAADIKKVNTSELKVWCVFVIFCSCLRLDKLLDILEKFPSFLV